MTAMRVICGGCVAFEMAWALLLTSWIAPHSLVVAGAFLSLCGAGACFIALVWYRAEVELRRLKAVKP